MDQGSVYRAGSGGQGLGRAGQGRAGAMRSDLNESQLGGAGAGLLLHSFFFFFAALDSRVSYEEIVYKEATGRPSVSGSGSLGLAFLYIVR